MARHAAHRSRWSRGIEVAGLVCVAVLCWVGAVTLGAVVSTKGWPLWTGLPVLVVFCVIGLMVAQYAIHRKGPVEELSFPSGPVVPPEQVGESSERLREFQDEDR